MTGRERGHRGDGQVRQLVSGQWQAVLSVTDPDTGRRKRLTKSVPTYREARTMLSEMQRRADSGQPVRDASITFSAWADRWSRDVLPASNRRPSSIAHYRGHLGKHLVPALGRIRLDRLRASDVDRLIVDLRAAGKAPATVRSIYNVLSAVLNDAVRDELIAVSPLSRVKRPTVPRTEAKHLAVTDVNSVMAAVAGTRLHPIVMVLIGTGVRRGEVLALRWVDVDLDEGVARVTGTLYRTDLGLIRSAPKTDKSRRELHLTPPLVAALRARRREQAADQLAAGSVWANVDGLVFTTVIGTPLEPRNVAREYLAAAKRAGVEGSLHTLRHTVATAMLAGGVDIRSVSDALGHSSPAVTLSVYAHTDRARQRAAAEVVTAALGLV
jgi:integrase